MCEVLIAGQQPEVFRRHAEVQGPLCLGMGQPDDRGDGRRHKNALKQQLTMIDSPARTWPALLHPSQPALFTVVFGPRFAIRGARCFPFDPVPARCSPLADVR